MPPLQKRFLMAFIAFLALTAALAVWAVLAGDEMSSLQVRVLLSSTTITVTSICGLASASSIRALGTGVPAALGIGVAALAAVLILVEVWWNEAGDTYERLMWSVMVLAIGWAHALLLLSARPRRQQRWVPVATVCAIGLVTGLVIGVIMELFDFEEALLKTVVVASVLAALGTLVVPILHVMARRDTETGPQAGERLVLHRDTDGLWRDATGRRHRVIALDKAPPAVSSPFSTEDGERPPDS